MEHFGLQVTVAPTAEPVTLADTKAWLRVESDDDSQDAVIVSLISAARRRAEKVSRRALVTQTLQLKLDRFPGCYSGGNGYSRLEDDPRVIRLPRPPALAVSSITYVDTTGTTQTLSASSYQVDVSSEPARVLPAYGEIWPTARDQLGAVVITYTAGYGAASAVPGDLKLALWGHVAHCWLHPDAIDEEYLDRLFDPFRWEA